MSFISGAFGSNNKYNAGDQYTSQDEQDAINAAKTAQANLTATAAGKGPNPSQGQFFQNTQDNASQAAGLAASQRGVDPALAAKMAMDNFADSQRKAAAQALTTQAQQQLQAQGMAGQQALAQQQLQIDRANSVDSINAGVASQNANTNGSIAGGILQGAGSAAGAFLAKGGMVKKMADGGMTLTPLNTGVGDSSSPDPAAGPQSKAGQYLKSAGGAFQGGLGNVGYDPTTGAPRVQVNTTAGGQALSKGIGSITMPMKASSLMAPASSNIGAVGGASDVGAAQMFAAKGGMIDTGKKLKAGGKVPGKAKVPGNSYANDTVKAQLSPGEGVIDRETMSDKGPVGDMARFVMAHVNSKKNGLSRGKKAA